MDCPEQPAPGYTAEQADVPVRIRCLPSAQKEPEVSYIPYAADMMVQHTPEVQKACIRHRPPAAVRPEQEGFRRKLYCFVYTGDLDKKHLAGCIRSSPAEDNLSGSS